MPNGIASVAFRIPMIVQRHLELVMLLVDEEHANQTSAMSQIIHATFADGAFQPDEDPRLPANARVRLTVEPLESPVDDRSTALRELEELWDTEEIQPGPPPLSRDQLHDRR